MSMPETRRSPEPAQSAPAGPTRMVPTSQCGAKSTVGTGTEDGDDVRRPEYWCNITRAPPRTKTTMAPSATGYSQSNRCTGGVVVRDSTDVAEATEPGSSRVNLDDATVAGEAGAAGETMVGRTGRGVGVRPRSISEGFCGDGWVTAGRGGGVGDGGNATGVIGGAIATTTSMRVPRATRVSPRGDCLVIDPGRASDS